MKQKFSKPVPEAVDYPYVEPSSIEYNGVDLQFYTKNYNITKEDKKSLTSLVQRPEFRVFEKYLDWRVNAYAHRMKSYLIDGEKDKATSEAAAIDSLVKITQDMQNFWNEVKMMDSEDEVLLKDRSEATPKPFGKDRYNIQ